MAGGNDSNDAMICIFIFLSLTFYSSPNFHTPRTKLMQQHAHHHTAAIFLLPRDRGSTASCLAVSVSHGATSYLDRPPCGVFYALDTFGIIPCGRITVGDPWLSIGLSYALFCNKALTYLVLSESNNCDPVLVSCLWHRTPPKT